MTSSKPLGLCTGVFGFGDGHQGLHAQRKSCVEWVEHDVTMVKQVTELQVGDYVDLESCPYLKDEPSAEFEWAEVVSVERETADCVAVGYEGIDVIGYPVETMLVVRNNAEVQPCAS